MVDLPITAPGIYDLDDATYHGDPCPTPSFSAGIGKTDLFGAPMHVAYEHPRLTVPELPVVVDEDGEEEEETGGKFDIGRAAHALHTKKGGQLVRIDPTKKDGSPSTSKATSSWREQAAAARAAGDTPLLGAEVARVDLMVTRSRQQLEDSFGYDPFEAVENNELALLWKEGETWCRCKPDNLDLDHRIAWDIKTTPGYANAQPWAEQQDRSSMIAMRAAHYLRGLNQLIGPGWRYRFWVLEQKPPHCAVAVELPGSWLERGDDQRKVALREFEHCLAMNRWKGWAKGVVVVDDPTYAEGKWVNARDNRPTEAALEIAREMQAPERMR